MLQITSTLMDRDEPADSTFGGYVSFSSPGFSVGVIWIDRQVWVDMGSPDKITAAVSAGDLLNVVAA